MDNQLEQARAFFNKMAPTWDTFSINNPEGAAMITEMGNIEPGSAVADIACGTGVLFSSILAKNPAELWGVDLSEKMLEIASKKYSDSRLHLWAGDFLKFRGSFDRVFIYRAYPHFPDKAAFAQKLHSILKPNGRFIIGHNESRQAINARHAGSAAHVSDILAPAFVEKEYFDNLFEIDILADTEYLYIISGKPK